MTQSSNPDQPPEGGPEQGFLAHLIELRDRLLRMVLAVLVVFLGLFPFANDIYGFLAGPLTALLPEGASMIATGIADPFLIPFKLVLMVSLLLALPYVLYQAWAFIAPGLYRHERRLAMPLVASSVLLFYAGMAFAYYVVFPLIFGFFISVAPDDVDVMPGIGQYLDFVLMLFLAFGIAFETPIATIMVVVAGITTPENLTRYRPYVIVGAFTVGMLLTPPDIISQVLLAIPMWILYELGIVFSRLVVKQKKRREQAEGGEVDEEYHPLSDEEMEAELDAMEAEESQHMTEATHPPEHPPKD